MPKKLTIEFVRKQFEKESCKLLTTEYENAHQKLEYTCSQQHESGITWSDWQQGHRCSECFGKKKLTISFIREQFEKEGYTLLTTEYKNNKQKLKFICPKEHENFISWCGWKQGQRCSECKGNKRLTIEFIREQFKKEEYILFSTEYNGSKSPLKGVCSKGHNISIRWDCWNNGHRCWRCYFESNTGKNSVRWNPNLTDEERRIERNYLEYKKWSYAVKERDSFTCQICGDDKGGNLVLHHLESYRVNPNLQTALNNGVCLCEKCHKAFHHKYGYGNNTREQFEEFRSILWYAYCVYF